MSCAMTSGMSTYDYSPRRRLICSQCSESFDHIAKLQIHETSHNVQCRACQKWFATWAHLTRHVDMNECPQLCLENYQLCPYEFPCLQCGCRFKTKASMLTHSRQKHHRQPKPKVERPYSCKDCFATFQYELSLRNHLTSHGQFNCLQCKKSFNCEAYLRNHILAFHSNRFHSNFENLDTLNSENENEQQKDGLGMSLCMDVEEYPKLPKENETNEENVDGNLINIRHEICQSEQPQNDNLFALHDEHQILDDDLKYDVVVTKKASRRGRSIPGQKSKLRMIHSSTTAENLRLNADDSAIGVPHKRKSRFRSKQMREHKKLVDKKLKANVGSRKQIVQNSFLPSNNEGEHINNAQKKKRSIKTRKSYQYPDIKSVDDLGTVSAITGVCGGHELHAKTDSEHRPTIADVACEIFRQPRFACNECSEKFYFKSDLQKHEAKHSVQCMQCLKWFATASHLERHRAVYGHCITDYKKQLPSCVMKADDIYRRQQAIIAEALRRQEMAASGAHPHNIMTDAAGKQGHVIGHVDVLSIGSTRHLPSRNVDQHITTQNLCAVASENNSEQMSETRLPSHLSPPVALRKVLLYRCKPCDALFVNKKALLDHRVSSHNNHGNMTLVGVKCERAKEEQCTFIDSESVKQECYQLGEYGYFKTDPCELTESIKTQQLELKELEYGSCITNLAINVKTEPDWFEDCKTNINSEDAEYMACHSQFGCGSCGRICESDKEARYCFYRHTINTEQTSPVSSPDTTNLRRIDRFNCSRNCRHVFVPRTLFYSISRLP